MLLQMSWGEGFFKQAGAAQPHSLMEFMRDPFANRDAMAALRYCLEPTTLRRPLTCMFTFLN
jgi:hypothetical protein